MKVIMSSFLDEHEVDGFDPMAWRVHQNYAMHPRDRVHALFIKAYQDDQLIGFAPVIMANRASSILLLRKRIRKWLSWVPSVFTTRRTAIVDASLMGYERSSPFYIRPSWPGLAETIRMELLRALTQDRRIENLWITGSHDISAVNQKVLGMSKPFQVIPMASVDVRATSNFSAYIDSLTSKRRRNLNQDKRHFSTGGGIIKRLDFPLETTSLRQAHQLLMNSHARSSYYAPYQELQNSWEPFHRQEGFMLAAFLGERMIGFMSFYPSGRDLLQTHGGFDYEQSLKLKAYANLTYEAIRLAIEHDCNRISLGPLNNETKRRLCNHLDPVWASIWCRSPIDRLAAKHVLIPNLEARCT